MLSSFTSATNMALFTSPEWRKKIQKHTLYLDCQKRYVMEIKYLFCLFCSVLLTTIREPWKNVIAQIKTKTEFTWELSNVSVVRLYRVEAHIIKSFRIRIASID